jgi:hypothetical protein
VNRKNNQSTFDESTDKYWDELEYQWHNGDNDDNDDN